MHLGNGDGPPLCSDGPPLEPAIRRGSARGETVSEVDHLDLTFLDGAAEAAVAALAPDDAFDPPAVLAVAADRIDRRDRPASHILDRIGA